MAYSYWEISKSALCILVPCLDHCTDVHPKFHRHRMNIELKKCTVPWCVIPPYINTNAIDHGVPVRCATDCVRKLCGTKCRQPVPVDDTCPDIRSFMADIGFYNTARCHRSVYPCCATAGEKRCATKTFRWTSTAQRQMDELCYPPRMVRTICTSTPWSDVCITFSRRQN